MQNLPLKLSATNQATVLQVAGNGFWYESAAGSPELRIIITPEYGSDLVLRPGQSVRLSKNIGTWTVRSYDNSATINGNIIIGSGEFSDNNTTVANVSGSVSVTSGNIAVTSGSVTVNNGVGSPVPVDIRNGQVEITNDAGNPLPVSGSINVAGSTVPTHAALNVAMRPRDAITAAVTSVTVATTGTQVLLTTSGNGILLKSVTVFSRTTSSNSNLCSYISLSGAISATLISVSMNTIDTAQSRAMGSVNKVMDLYIPAGVNIYCYANMNGEAEAMRSITYVQL